MGHRITLVCDNCDLEYTLNEGMEIPPYWLGVQIAIGNQHGILPSKEMFVHLCSIECLIQFAKTHVKEYKCFVDREEIEESEDE